MVTIYTNTFELKRRNQYAIGIRLIDLFDTVAKNNTTFSQ